MRALPRDESSDLDFLLFRQHDVLSRAQALAHFTEKAVRHRVDTGRWQRPRPGVYVLRAAPDDDDQRRWIAVLAGPPGTVTAGRTALAQLGMRGFHVHAIHLLIPSTARGRDAPHDVIVHRTRRLEPSDVHDLGSPPCTMPARSVVDAAQWARSDDSEGRQRYLDALFEQHGVHAEIDGAQHLDVRGYWADMRRQNALWVRGERVLRFPAWAVRNRPDEVLETVRAALRAAGWTG
ncbi:DUF559 domain-containing protein [Catellatospora paridis]|uniref:DUF559 domain-containing protein n=1 Tax=Catellatospora paridis TaxID=1617086 RepID=UPI001E378034|nr:DUF559 domain-containing protein [Catellatospora paridis]